MPVLVVGNRVISATPGARPILNHAESMMQPVDDEGQKRREGPAMKVSAEELREAQLDPYIQNTGEETGGYGGYIGNLDADGNLIDPPGGMSGGGDGVMMSDNQNVNNDELNASDGQNLEPSDGKL